MNFRRHIENLKLVSTDDENQNNNHNKKMVTARDQTSTKEFDYLVSTKMNDLSVQERSDGLYDLHGVSELKEENPDMIQKKLAEMNLILNIITTTCNNTSTQAAYNQAVAKSPTYVEKLKIPCLRAEEYNSQEAARLLIRYFDRKKELFGEEKLVKDIAMKDLDDEEIKALKRGVFQVLPQRDRAGRAIMFIHGVLSLSYETKTVMRVIFYLSMSVLQDEETQRRGIVAVYYAVGQKKIVQGRVQEYWKSWISTPWRLVACHYCVEKSTVLFEGTAMECVYNLMTFGIPKNSLPIDLDDTMDLTSHNLMLQTLRRREEEESKRSKETTYIFSKNISDPLSASTLQNKWSNASGSGGNIGTSTKTLLIPDPMDVLMGRGRQPQSRPGSLRLRNLLLKYRETYDKGTKVEKTETTEKVLREMKASGSRFLAVIPGGYEECSDWVARDKISHGFRNLRMKKTASSRSLSPAAGTDTDTASGDRKKLLAKTENANTSRKRSFGDKYGNKKEKALREG